MKLPNENSHQVFKTRRVIYAGADELELYSVVVLLRQLSAYTNIC